MTDYADWQTPAAHAAQIFSTGVPLYSKSSFASSNTYSIPATMSQAIPTAAISQIGYEISISFNATNGSVNPLEVKLVFTDSTSGLVTDAVTFGVRAGPVANPHVVKLTGPTSGDTLNVTLDNSATGFTANVTYALLQNSRSYARHSGRTITWGQITGDTQPKFDMAQNIIAAINSSVSLAGGQITRVLPFWAGPVSLNAQTTSGAADLQIAVEDTWVNGQFPFDGFSDAHGKINNGFTLPRSQCQLIVTNHNAAGITLTLEMVIQPPDL